MNKRNIIFYFSQSGNSLYVAKKIAASIGEYLMDVSTVKTREICKRNKEK